MGGPLSRGFVLAVLCSGVLVGCSFQGVIEQNVVDFNHAVAKSQNELLLLNILRAKDRQPRYFTALTQIRGSLSSSVKMDLILPFGPGTDSRFGVLPESSLSSSPSFDVAILDSEKFMRGIMRPVEKEIFKYYWDEGWPQELLLYLLVAKIRFPGVDGRLKEVSNAPTHHEKFGEFVEAVKKIAHVGLVASLETHQPFGPQFKELDLTSLLAAKEKGLEIASENGCFQFMQPHPTVQLECPEWDADPEKGCPRMLRELPGISQKGTRVQLRFEELVPSAKSRATATRESVCDNRLTGETEEPIRGEIILRSPEAIMHYLGEIVRVEEEHDRWSPPEIREATGHAPSSLPLFVVKAGQAQAADVAVEFNGRNYYIPSGAAGGRSMHCLWLLTELFGLHKSFDELPATPAVILSGSK